MVTLPPMRIRPASAADVDKMLDLLEPEEFVQPLTRAELRRLFDYEWADTKINFGIVLEAGESVVTRCLGAGDDPCVGVADVMAMLRVPPARGAASTSQRG